MSVVFDIEEIRRRCDEFYALYRETEGSVYDMCYRKMVHTAAVAENCVTIAKHQGLNGYDCELAWIIGELHDFARFGQAIVSHTFRDSSRYNHAEVGARMLFAHKMIDDLIPNYAEVSEADRRVMKKAILYHSDLHLPEDLTERERIFCEIIRDADKIDIFRTIATNGWETIYGHTKEEILASDISDVILAAFPRHEPAEYAKRVLPADYYMAHIALCFGLQSEAARKMVAKQGYLGQLMSIAFDDAKVQEKFLHARKCVEEWMCCQICAN